MAVGPGAAWHAAFGAPLGWFSLDGDVYRLKPAGWIAAAPVLGAFETYELWPLAVLQGLLDRQDWQALMWRVIDHDDPLDLLELRVVVQELLEHTFGRPYHHTCRLLALAVANWGQVDPALFELGVNAVDLFAREPARLPGLLWVVLVQGKAEKDRMKWEAEIERPPTGLAAGTSWSAEDEGAAFEAALQAGSRGRRR